MTAILIRIATYFTLFCCGGLAGYAHGRDEAPTPTPTPHAEAVEVVPLEGAAGILGPLDDAGLLPDVGPSGLLLVDRNGNIYLIGVSIEQVTERPAPDPEWSDRCQQSVLHAPRGATTVCIREDTLRKTFWPEDFPAEKGRPP